jgi:hypothetical protein
MKAPEERRQRARTLVDEFQVLLKHQEDIAGLYASMLSRQGAFSREQLKDVETLLSGTRDEAERLRAEIAEIIAHPDFR